MTKGKKIDLDPNVIEALPHDCAYDHAEAFLSSLWARIAKIETTRGDGSKRYFFVKLSIGEVGRLMVEGEYEGMKAIHNTVPSFAPEPIAWGACTHSPETYFYICQFLDLEKDALVEVKDTLVKEQHALVKEKEFCINLAKLHKDSVSPEGKFGFHVTTCNGNIPQENAYKDSWEDFFAAGLKHMLVIDRERNGVQKELDEASSKLFDHVIPRLLRPLETGPTPIKPALVHGDLWWGNAGNDLERGKPVIFDAAAFYGHNE